MKLLIENFYNIKHAELDFKKFNILIGPQAAGKSLIAKAYHIVVEALNMYNLAFLNESQPKFIEEKIETLLSSTFERYSANDASRLELSAEGIPILTITQSKITLNNEFAEEAQKITPKAKSFLLDAIDVSNDRADLAINMIIEGILDAKRPFSLFVPASRSLVNIVTENLFWMTDNNIDFLLNRFGRLYFNQLKEITANQSYSCPQMHSVIKGNLEKNNDIYSINEQGRSTSIFNASSGQQSTIPILVALEAAQKSNGKYLFIEEPEAHIFPDAQSKLIRYIAETQKQTNADITLTTHSPYLLTTVNTLIYANSVASQSEEKAAKVREIIPESEWLKAEDVAAYMVNEDGTVESIFDDEEGLIIADSIDDISDVIGNKYNQLLDIEFDEEEQND